MATVAACLALWVARRPEQFSRPYVWAEESIIVHNYLQHGWAAAVEPVNGSLNFPATPLITAAAALDLSALATVNTASAAAVFALTVWILVVPDSAWGGIRSRIVMAATMPLCPTDPEVFGVALYAFWWASLWPLIILGWTRPHWRARIPLLAVAALSSPAAGALFFLFTARARLQRRLEDLVSAAVLAAGLLVETAIAIASGRAGKTSHEPVDLGLQVLRSFGVFVMPWTFGGPRPWTWLAVLGAGLIALLTFAALCAPPGIRMPAVLLAAGCLIYAALSALPAPLISDPRDAGPRYYFLPFVALLWLLIHLATLAGRSHRVRYAAGVLALCGLIGLFPLFHRADRNRTAHLDWPQEIQRCADSRAAVVDVPVYHAGSGRFFRPPLLLTPEQCRAGL